MISIFYASDMSIVQNYLIFLSVKVKFRLSFQYNAFNLIVKILNASYLAAKILNISFCMMVLDCY